MSRTPTQTIRCLDLGRYRAALIDGRLRVRGPLPMAPNLQASVMENRVEIMAILKEYCGGAWPPLAGSPIHSVEDDALDLIEVHWEAA